MRKIVTRMRDLQLLSRAQLAQRNGVATTTLVRFEAGSRAPSWRLFRQLCDSMGYLPRVTLIPKDEIAAVRHETILQRERDYWAVWGRLVDDDGWTIRGEDYGPLGLGGLAADKAVEPFEVDALPGGPVTTVGGVSDGQPAAEPSDRGFETIAIHAGQEPDASTGAVVPPIHQVSTYAQDGVGGLRGGYEYSRSANPTRTALEECLAGIEAAGGHGRGFAFASGLAAEDALIRTVCRPGDHVVIPGDAYGGTFRLFARVLSEWGVAWTAVRQDDPAAVADAMRPETRVVWCETPTNPLLTVADIAALAAIAHDGGALLGVDNTFASSYLQQPLTLGADVVMHSTTKYLGGHSDVVGGALVVADPELGERIAFTHNAAGAVAGPFDSWLVLRGIKTLAVRMERHCDNAEAVVAMLRDHRAVTEVLYPDGDPVAAKQMRRFGGMVSFRVGDEQRAVDICNRARVFTLAESLGGVESLIEHPGRMTHASAAGSQLEVPSDLVRLSVGLESAPDLIADLESALS